MSENEESIGLKQRIEVIEAGYEYLLAYAAQGRQDDAGSDARRTLTNMALALEGLGELMIAAVDASVPDSTEDAADFLEQICSDADVARGAINLVLSRPVISSMLVDNLNASIHLRALLTDLFLVEQALRAPSGGAPD